MSALRVRDTQQLLITKHSISPIGCCSPTIGALLDCPGAPRLCVRYLAKSSEKALIEVLAASGAPKKANFHIMQCSLGCRIDSAPASEALFARSRTPCPSPGLDFAAHMGVRPVSAREV